jgi:uncharacterized damage-inducible protein DinB
VVCKKNPAWLRVVCTDSHTVLQHGIRQTQYENHCKALTGGKSTWEWQTSDRAAIKAMFKAGDEAAIQAVRASLASGEPFADPWKVGTYQSNPAHFLQQDIVHDSHHRGQIIALLRQSGYGKEQLDKLEEHWDIWQE